MTGHPTPAKALRLLLEGNQRFVSGARRHPHQDADRRAEIAPAQRPFAALFGCSDSRLAAELIFDRGLGDLFVVRTAGHVVGPEILGSIEFAVETLDTPLVVVLGHDSCGAVAAADQAITTGSLPDGALRDVVERVMLSLLAAYPAGGSEPDRLVGRSGGRDRPTNAGLDSGSDLDRPTSVDLVIDEHVRYTVDLLLRRSTRIAERLSAGRCGLVGLRYRLVEGTVRIVVRHGV